MERVLGRFTLLISACFLISTGTMSAPVEIDRVLAAVNGRIITETDLKAACDLNSLLSFGKPCSLAGKSKEDELNRLVDLALISQEMENFPLSADDQRNIEAQMEELKNGYAEIGGLDFLIRRLGLQEDQLQDYLRLQASFLHFVNVRFRPFVNVEPDEVEAYYREHLVPQLKQENAAVPPLEEVRSKIESILTEQKVNTSLENWLKDLRSHSHIEFFTRDGDKTAGVPGSSGALQWQSAASPSATGDELASRPEGQARRDFLSGDECP